MQDCEKLRSTRLVTALVLSHLHCCSILNFYSHNKWELEITLESSEHQRWPQVREGQSIQPSASPKGRSKGLETINTFSATVSPFHLPKKGKGLFQTTALPLRGLCVTQERDLTKQLLCPPSIWNFPPSNPLWFCTSMYVCHSFIYSLPVTAG